MKRTDSAVSPILSAFRASIKTRPVSASVDAPQSDDFAMGDLLSVAQSFDGSKDARYAVAHDAIRRAYKLALSGRDQELLAVVRSTGKGKHIKAMREAVTLTGTPKGMRDSPERDNKLDTLVSQCLALYADVAFAPAVKREPKAKAPAVSIAESDASVGAGAGAGDDTGASTSTKQAQAPALDVAGWLNLLSDDDLQAHARLVMDMIAARAALALRAA